MKKLNVIELFCGSGSISKEFKSVGHNVFSIDIRRRKGVCEPDLRKDIMKVRLSEIPFKKVHVIWASPPCDVFSRAGAKHHWDSLGNPSSTKCIEHISILKKTISLIERISPGYFFIENPCGKMKHRREIINFLIRNDGQTKRLYYCNYGFGTDKPTNIFTNALDLKFKKSPGEISKSIMVDFSALTKCQKQAIPQNLAKEIREYCESKYT